MNTKSFKVTATLIVAGTMLVSVVYANQFASLTPARESTDIEDRVSKLEARIVTLEHAIATNSSIKNSSSIDNGLVEFEEVVLNLAAVKNEIRFLKTSLVFSVDAGNELALANAIKNHKSRLMNTLIAVAAETRAADILGKDKLTQLAGKLKEKLNAVLTKNGHKPYIKDVLYQTFQVQ